MCRLGAFKSHAKSGCRHCLAAMPSDRHFLTGKRHLYGERRRNATHVSVTDSESRLYRKSSAAPTQLSNLDHVLTDNRHGLVVNVCASTADGYKACRDLKVTRHVARNTRCVGGCAIDGLTTRHRGYAMSQRRRQCIEQCFGWGKSIGPIRRVMVRGLAKVDQLLKLTMTAYNLTRLRTLAALCPQLG